MTSMDKVGRRRHDLLSAALRHVRDAEHLADTGSPGHSLDQAEHLAGFGPECARKALLSLHWADKAVGHDFEGFGELALEWVVALDPEAARYSVARWGASYPSLVGWDPACRYCSTGTATKHRARVEQLVSESRRAVDEVALALWADGVLDWSEVP